MNRFFVDVDGRDIGTDISITGGDVNHIKNVLRLKVGQEITVSNGRGRDYTCSISEIGRDEVLCRVEDVNDNFAELPVEVTLFQGYPKSDKMDLIVQKMVELGVCRIVPAIEMAKTLDMNIIPYEEAEGLAKSRQIIADVTAPSSARRSLGVFIGPEGGFAREEVEQAMAAGAECITLGHRILRTETAGLAVMSIIMFSADRDN